MAQGLAYLLVYRRGALTVRQAYGKARRLAIP
jgi:hypothetical protein